MKAKLAPLVVAGLVAIASPHAYSGPYSGMVVFGDSLSDAGQRPQAGAVTNPVRHTNTLGPAYGALGAAFGSTSPMLINDGLGLAPQVASTNAVRAAMGLPDGNNWAVGGYTTVQVYESIVGTFDPATTYGGSEVRAGLDPSAALIRGRDGYLVSLQKSGQRIDGDTLFYINGGGNDFLQGLIVSAPTAMASANRLGDSVRALQAAGGRYFMMPLLVDVASPVGGGLFNPAQYALSQVFNGELVRQMASIDANVIPLNVPLLYSEILADPSRFGFDPTQNLLASCFDATLACHNPTWGAASATADPSKLLYADWVHPTTAVQRILADQALSILSAPWEVSLLPEMANASLRASQDALRNQWQADWGNWQEVGRWRAFVAGDARHQNFTRASASASGDGEGYGLNLGGSYRLNDNWRVGLAASLQEQNLEVGEQDSEYSLRSYLGSAFAQYHDGLVWADAGLSAGYLDYRDLKRKFALGITSRSEKGDSDGYLVAFSGRLGVELGTANQALRLSPFISADYVHIDVQGYDEKGASSTALGFADQTRKSQRLGLGVQARYQFTPATALYGEILREEEFEDDQRDVRMRLNSVQAVDFKLQGYAPEGQLTRASLGLQHRLSPELALVAGYNYRHAANDNLHGANLSLVFDW
jgi:outer membrane lipase/esterase